MSQLNRDRSEQLAFIQRLLEVAPSFGPQFRSHEEFHNGKVLPHVLIGDFTRWFVELFRESKESAVAGSHVRDLVQFLEAEYTAGGEQVENLIAVSFLENLGSAGS